MSTERNRGGRSQRRTVVLRWAAVLLALALIVAGSLALAGRLVGVGPARHSDNQNSSANGPRTASHGPPGYSPEQTAAHSPLTSPVDYNHDGVDDYTAMVRGAHQEARRHPHYDSGYYQGGYPPDDRGACTDEIWRAFRQAGYDLKTMVDADIASSPGAYAGVINSPDPNIDFRRTNVLGVFLSRHAQRLTNDTATTDQWQQGDIVIFDTSWHIGMASDRRDSRGIPLLLHNMGQRDRENDYLGSPGHRPITGHFRFDASKIQPAVLRPWRG
ncbi:MULTISPECIES: DUF1287 domain-containing protein [Bifidobacterium]|uniref:DUF1287 domain-containing protein n=1 Tax=Bifidobacterium apousia TaxID=2750996 RepID=A0A556R198_9BIFI|nr:MULTISPECIES: DUF1287 domain-containing protein [Bifidobacterium]MBI0072156.1 DUF1287 domain-containing protein [Bifidobacterium sp. W8112]MBI0136129.1 DUF1287 domain-containing protein [Bifidobacterium sp. W8120]MBI0125331.1 DUF1287 domain-containing protein [Bifidobacterium apousia]MDT7510830.1 DUF1287 domain-containing protein [Bifidobacterium sp. H6bp9]TSJ82665.1 DUF1287 domain-containing protein [Bifidobacterium apousia]